MSNQDNQNNFEDEHDSVRRAQPFNFGSYGFCGSPGSYGSGVRSQVFEVIVRQALKGAPWEQICAGPMEVNKISREEVIEEVRKRGGGDQPPTAPVPRRPLPDEGSGSIALPLPRKPDDESGWK